MLPQFFPRQCGIISHLTESADAHFLEITFEVRGGEPVCLRHLFLAQTEQRAAEPVSNVAFIGEQVPGFAQILRRSERMLKMRTCFRKIAAAQSSTAQRELRANVLADWTTFAAFPWLKLAAGDEFQGLYMLAGLIVKGAKLDAQIIALPDEAGIFFQFAQALLRFFAKPFPELVAFVEQPGISGICPESLVVCGAGLHRLLEYVKITNA